MIICLIVSSVSSATGSKQASQGQLSPIPHFHATGLPRGEHLATLSTSGLSLTGMVRLDPIARNESADITPLQACTLAAAVLATRPE